MVIYQEEEDYNIKELLKAHQLTILARNSEASLSLSDKNRLLANVNTNIQQKFIAIILLSDHFCSNYFWK